MSDANQRSPKVFISYRRDDETVAHMLYLSFLARYGKENVFKDNFSILPGDEFPEAIQQALRRCDVLLALIGPTWLKQIQEKAIDEIDYVRNEIHTALKQKKLVVPVRIRGAEQPPVLECHYLVRPMLNKQAVELHNVMNTLEVDALLASIHQEFENWSATREEVQRMDEFPPAAGLALGYFDNFLRRNVPRIAELTLDGSRYKHTIEIKERGGDSLIHAFGDEPGSRDFLKLYVVIPPSVDCLLPERLDPVLKRLDQAFIRASGAARPFALEARRIGDHFQLIDFPSALGVLNTWLRRHFAKPLLDSDSSEWRRTQADEVRRFESILKWWIDDPVNGVTFRDRVRLLRFTGEEAELDWLTEFWEK